MSRRIEMQDLIARWETSDLSQRQFMEQEGVSYSQFQYWRRRLRHSTPQERRRSSAPVSLVPVRIIPDPPTSTPAFELWTTRGLSLSVPTGFDESELRRLLDVLVEC